MQRRDFMILGSITGLSACLKAESAHAQKRDFKKIRPVIAAVQEHMFPKNSTLPSARSMHTIDFTEETIFHHTYDKDIRTFVIAGAQELIAREERFLSYSPAQKEKALRAYEQTAYGSNWLARIMTLTMEALFSDPVYGSNINESGWRAIKSFGGIPRPTTRYIA
ncbi:MAG: gluconate 2-dehydrogenase subunit 3 family protein [Sulfurovum sp.]|nr:gluconate 2-dehydrogenase subunit 3 family protein [Sulfurovum sp.]